MVYDYLYIFLNMNLENFFDFFVNNHKCSKVFFFPFLIIPISGFCVKVVLILKNDFGHVPHLFYFEKLYEKDWYQLFLKCLISCDCESVQRWDFLYGGHIV